MTVIIMVNSYIHAKCTRHSVAENKTAKNKIAGLQNDGR